MKILIHPNAAIAADRVAETLIGAVLHTPDLVLGLATGGTMEPVYARLAAAHRAGRFSFARATSFNLDEYIGLGPEHPCSYHHYMAEHLFDHVDFATGATHLPDGLAAVPRDAAEAYEAAIAAAGGIDLQVLGLGRNGHIGFNEPVSSFASRTRPKTLARSTRMANQRYFSSLEATPRYALTMGIGTILQARRIVLLATGAAKAEAARAMIEGPVAAIHPASILQHHPHADIHLDVDAASALALRDYYEDIHPGGAEPPF